MATIKAIHQKSVHQIQSGQVIVDLNSVVKELVENSVDAGATSIEVRFRNHGLDAIEVVDNGSGISRDDYESVALKHHTSKLSTYDDLESLSTFGFRGEALASLCALSKLHVITARDVDAPKGSRLEFEFSGKLRSTAIVAAQKGTRVVVENLFHNLPVRKKELEKNIKREYGKVLALLQAYACISTGIRFVVSNQMPKAGKNVAFSTNMNTNTKDNITNVFGVKTSHALIRLDLRLALRPSRPGFSFQPHATTEAKSDSTSQDVIVQGHVSRPVFGEGRQAPDRQFFFVNSRPCGLPQVAKAFNEAYKSFNVSQSPFIFANLVMDTYAYDVNVSPDKRTILLHDQTELLESLETALLQLFEEQEQSVPQSKLAAAAPTRLPSYRPLTIMDNAMDRTGSGSPEASSQPATEDDGDDASQDPLPQRAPHNLIHEWMGRDTVDRTTVGSSRSAKQEQAPALVQNAFDRMRPLRTPKQVAEITVGGTTTRTVIGTGGPYKKRRIHTIITPSSASSLHVFAMPGSQLEHDNDDGDVEATDEENYHRVTEDEEDCPSDLTSADDEESHARHDDDVSPSHKESSPQRVGQAQGVDNDVGSRQTRAPGKVQIETSEYNRQVSTTEPVSTQSTACPFLHDHTDDEEENEPEWSPREEEAVVSPSHHHAHSEDSDGDYDDEDARANGDTEEVARLIRDAEVTALQQPSSDNTKRAHQAMRGSIGSRYSVLNLTTSSLIDLHEIKQQALLLGDINPNRNTRAVGRPNLDLADYFDKADAESRLSLTVSKADFRSMSVAGQFNLGFIIAMRPSVEAANDDLFIIDQHAADEKFNFERFTHSLELDSQRLAQPKKLYLTAVEEEIILNHSEALTANGFIIETDTSGTSLVGERCKLICLPMSRDTTFDLSDLEELLHFLSDHSATASAHTIPRPTKVRKMLAMRACRSSIMVGKTLNQPQMQRVVGNLGEMDKPWNCPHGRPTMRHLAGLGSWEAWDEQQEYQRGDGDVGGGPTKWRDWVRKVKMRDD
ncbi:hypothetical protein AAFC00_002371 [Neodothiora populina]|uniref:DNA mismatch repair protein MutL n=1 Tax=Neodothiora populina TaxID=2781224 RepID=A0ABR3PID1_9PEZI